GGCTFLRAFSVTIASPARTLRLHRYAVEDRFADEFHRVGVLLQSSGNTYVVAKTLPNTDAALHAPSSLRGATLVAIDQQAVMGRDSEDVDRMLRGHVGDTHVIAFSVAGATQTTTLAVDDVLALP